MKTEFFLKPGDLIGFYKHQTHTEHVGVYIGLLDRAEWVLWSDIGLQQFYPSALHDKDRGEKSYFIFLGSFL